MSPPPHRDERRGAVWLVADMSLNIWALSIVKALGADYPSIQIVFIRAVIGFILISPLIWRDRALFRNVPEKGLHLVRIFLSVVTLTASFFALPRVPLAVFTAVGFVRPLVTMLMAAVLLRETIGPRRWIAAAIAFAGVLIAVEPGRVTWNIGLFALLIVVLSGSGAIIATRRLRAAPPVLLMAFYTLGLGAVSLPFAIAFWHPVQSAHVLPLLLVGVFAQAAQLCFLRAHFLGGAGVLSVLSYFSLVLSVGVGYVVFDEVPGVGFALGASLVIAAALWVTFDRSAAGSGPRA